MMMKLDAFGFKTGYLNNQNKLTNFCIGKDGKLGLFLHQSFVYKNPNKNKYYKSTSEIYDLAYRVLAASVEDAELVNCFVIFTRC